jgi:hypothetical protein
MSMSDPGAQQPEQGASVLAGRPLRDFRIEAAANNGRFFSLLSSNVFGYAGDDPNPRALPNRTLYTIKKKMSDYLQAGVIKQARSDADDKPPWAWDAFNLAFCSDRVKMPLDEVIPVPREDLWWLVAPNDLVLLSDRVTHHYTTVDHIARENDRIYFIDEWPDRIFLKAGLNSADVAARVDPYLAGILDNAGLKDKKQVSITRAEFLRVIVGVVTLDTPALMARYLAYRPEAKEKFAVRFSFGAALMDVESDRLAKFAVPHFKAAWRLAAAQPQCGDAELAAARLYQALAITEFVQLYTDEPLAAKPFADELKSLLAQLSEQALLDRLEIEEIARIGNAAGHAQQFDAALRYLDHAVARGPAHEGARHLRAMARSQVGDWHAVVEDLDAALAANAERTRAREAERDARDPRDRHGLDDDAARLGGLRGRRCEELELLFNACVNLQDFARARVVAAEVVALEPERASGHRMLGALAMQAGDMAAARRLLGTAREKETSAGARAQLDRVLASLAPTGQAP